MSASSRCGAFRISLREPVTHERSKLVQEFASELLLLVDRNTEAEAELGIVFEKRIRPGRAATVAFFA